MLSSSKPFWSELGPDHDDRHGTRQYLRDCSEQRGVVSRIRRVLERHRYFRPGPRLGIAAKEEKLVPCLDLTIRVAYAGSAIVCRVREPTRRVDVVTQPGTLLVQHAPRCIHRAGHLHARDVLRD